MFEQVRQRQPDGADLLPAWRQAVEDAAGDNEMGAGVVVAERQAGMGIEQRGAEADERGREPEHGGGGPRRRAGKRRGGIADGWRRGGQSVS